MALSTKLQVLSIILISQDIFTYRRYNPSIRDLQRALIRFYAKHRSIRQIRRHLATLESQGAIIRNLRGQNGGRYMCYAQATDYSIPDLELTLELFGS